jgi:predicted metal-binding protein
VTADDTSGLCAGSPAGPESESSKGDGIVVAQVATTPRALGKTVSDEALEADLERYRQLALELGAADAVVIPGSYVTIDERVRLKCVVPRCLRAGETPNCPPHAPDLQLVRTALEHFSWAVVVKCQVEPLEEYAPGAGATRAEQRRTLSFHRESSDIVFALERQAYKDGYHLTMGFGGGSCKDYLCQGMICQFLDSGRCRFPHRARPAMEAMGIDVVALINRLGWEVYPLLDDLSLIPCAVTVGIVFIH